MQSSLLQIFKLRVAVTVLITLISLTAVQGNPSTQVWVRRAADPAAAQNYRRPGLLRAGLRRFTSQLARVVPQPLKVLPRRITQPIEDFKIPESVKRRVDQIRAQMQRLARVRFNHGITDPAQIEPVLTRLSVLVKRIYGYYLYRDPANHALNYFTTYDSLQDAYKHCRTPNVLSLPVKSDMDPVVLALSSGRNIQGVRLFNESLIQTKQTPNPILPKHLQDAVNKRIQERNDRNNQ